jgi:hypothetical protein
MIQGNKYLLRTIVSDLLDFYEEFSAHEMSIHDYDKAIHRLEMSFKTYFSEVSFHEHPSTSKDEQHDTPIYIASFLMPFEDSVKNHTSQNDIIISYLNIKYALSLIGNLKKCIQLGRHDLIFVLERNTFKKTIFHMIGKKVIESYVTSSTFKITKKIDNQCEIVDSFFNELFTAGAVDINTDYSVATDFFSDFWEYLTDFVRSALINYHIAYGGFGLIHICKVCGKIFLPQKSGEMRGIFCSTLCKNLHYKTNNKVLSTCIQNQKNRINTMTTLCSSIESHDLSKNITIPTIEACRDCLLIRKLEQERSVKAGKCPVLLNDRNFSLLTEAYLKQKELNKIKNKKQTNVDNDEYSLSFRK